MSVVRLTILRLRVIVKLINLGYNYSRTVARARQKGQEITLMFQKF